MGLALEEAHAAVAHGDVPVGAVVLAANGAVIARRHNERELRSDPTAHAELLAVRDAAAALGSWRLNEATLVVTLEPCPMCAGAAWASRLGRLVFGTPDPTPAPPVLCTTSAPILVSITSFRSWAASEPRRRPACSTPFSPLGATGKVAAGGMRERPNRTVSKTVVPPGTVGSNPTPSAGQPKTTSDSAGVSLTGCPGSVSGVEAGRRRARRAGTQPTELHPPTGNPARNKPRLRDRHA
jgi:tRNA(Arg) A34 adenosine deaminase TadA